MGAIERGTARGFICLFFTLSSGCMHACMCTHTHAWHSLPVGVRRQFMSIDSFLLPCGPGELRLDNWA